jgi:uncharacterized damage-inducible protein DinB
MPNATPLKDAALIDLDRELAVTRRVLERLPEEKFDWKPHAKSMSLGQLSSHVVNLLGWARDTLDRDVLDLATIKPPAELKTRSKMLETFDELTGVVKQSLAKLDDESLTRTWTLQRGENIMHSAPRITILRLWCLNHLIHHRGQLCVLLRLLDVPVPVIYFNSADEPAWSFD